MPRVELRDELCCGLAERVGVGGGERGGQEGRGEGAVWRVFVCLFVFVISKANLFTTDDYKNRSVKL